MRFFTAQVLPIMISSYFSFYVLPEITSNILLKTTSSIAIWMLSTVCLAFIHSDLSVKKLAFIQGCPKSECSKEEFNKKLKTCYAFFSDIQKKWSTLHSENNIRLSNPIFN